MVVFPCHRCGLRARRTGTRLFCASCYADPVEIKSDSHAQAMARVKKSIEETHLRVRWAALNKLMAEEAKEDYFEWERVNMA